MFSTFKRNMLNFLQVQQWLGNELNPTNYGWIIGEDGSYSPNIGLEDICPKAILKVIHCNCTKGCKTQACGCRKLNIVCTTICNCEDNANSDTDTCCNKNSMGQSTLDQDSSDEEDDFIGELDDERVATEPDSDSEYEFPS